MAQVPPISAPGQPVRPRLTLDLSEPVSLLLDHISDITGVPRTQLANQALLDALPDLLARADALKKRYSELNSSKPKK